MTDTNETELPTEKIKPHGLTGVQNALKFDTPEKRKELFCRFCTHLMQRFSIRSFPYCAYETMRSYIKKYPEDCPKDVYEYALRVRMKKHEQIGDEGMRGKIDGFNAKAYAFITGRLYGWTEKTHVVSEEVEPQTEQEVLQEINDLISQSEDK